jgi:DNA repair exonuclease SbcCD ATPase subunit
MKTRSQTIKKMLEQKERKIAKLKEYIKDLESREMALEERLDLPCELCELNGNEASKNHALFKYWIDNYMKLRYTIVDSCEHCKTEAGVPHCECGCFDEKIESYKAKAIKPH